MILFDARALQGEQPTGVGNYTKQIANALKKSELNHNIQFLHTGIKQTHAESVRIPNKLLNLGMLLADTPTLEQLSKSKPSVIFIPNLNFVATNPETPYILTVHDLSFHHHPQWYSKKMRLWHKAVNPKRLIQNAKHVIAVSRATRNDCIKTFNIPEKNITTIYPGITQYKPSAQQPLIKQPYILSIGAIEPRKNLQVLFRAFIKLKKKHPSLKLVLAGPVGHKGRKILNSMKHEDVTYLGYVTHQTKINLLTHTKIFAYPSLFEGFGFPALEAMMTKTPVVASWTTSLKEILGDNALLTHPHNHDELELAIDSILADQSLTNKLTEQGYAHAQTFTWNRCATQTAEILKNTTNKTQSSPLNPQS